MIRTRALLRHLQGAVFLAVDDEQRTRAADALVRVDGDARALGEVGVCVLTHLSRLCSWIWVVIWVVVVVVEFGDDDDHDDGIETVRVAKKI